MAAAFVQHENLFNALKDATGLHETICASVQFIHPPLASSGSRAVSFFPSIKGQTCALFMCQKLKINIVFAITMINFEPLGLKNKIK